MDTPDNLRYSKEHEWINAEHPTEAPVGITDYAQSQLGDIVFLDFQVKVGDDVEQEQTLANVESVKAVSEIFAPVSGKVVEVNTALADKPELLNTDPYGEGWLVKIAVGDAQELDALMTADAYTGFVEDEKGE